MPATAVARRYGKALFELAAEEGRTEEMRRELGALAKLIEGDPELSDVLLQPLHPAEQRKAVLKGVAEQLGSSPILQSFYAFLIQQRRLVDIAAISAEYDRLANERVGLTKAQVRTASPLRQDQLGRLKRALSSRTDRRVELEVEIDETLLGGVVAQVGDLVFDGSLRSQLEQLRTSLVKG